MFSVSENTFHMAGVLCYAFKTPILCLTKIDVESKALAKDLPCLKDVVLNLPTHLCYFCLASLPCFHAPALTLT
jgi:hypothetical protein